MRLRSPRLPTSFPSQRLRKARRYGRPTAWLLATSLAGSLVGAMAAPAWAQSPAEPDAAEAKQEEAKEPPLRSALDAPLFYQLLIGEMEAQQGRVGNAFQVVLDAAKRTQSPQLYQRAVELALRGRSGDSALLAARQWRQAQPESVEALRTLVQLLAALNRPEELASPLQQLLKQAPAAERAAMISSVPRFLAGIADKDRALGAAESALGPFLQDRNSRGAARVALGRMALNAGKADLALNLARSAAQEEPGAMGPLLLAIEMMGDIPAAEDIIKAGLKRAPNPGALHMAYARSLEQQQRLVEAVAQLEEAVKVEPGSSQAWLALGAHYVDLHQPRQAVAALERFLAQPGVKTESAAGEPPEADSPEAAALRMLDWAWNLKAQAWLQLNGLAQAQEALQMIPAARDDLSVAMQRAELLRRQGKLEEGRRLLREAPLQGRADDRARISAEASLLREDKRLQEAYDLLLKAVRAAPDDNQLIYELAMTAERLKRFEDMEVLLRRVIQLKPDDAQAFNALGYSLVERGERTDEARQLLQKALALAPRDAFIIDSMGWLEFRTGNQEAALKLLRQAWQQRPHAEVAAHFGEVLWVNGQKDEAMRVWRDGLAREADNEALLETTRRLKVSW